MRNAGCEAVDAMNASRCRSIGAPVVLGEGDLGGQQEGRREVLGRAELERAVHQLLRAGLGRLVIAAAQGHPPLELHGHRFRLRLVPVLRVPGTQPGGGAKHAVPFAGIEHGLERAPARAHAYEVASPRASQNAAVCSQIGCDAAAATLVPELVRVVVVRHGGLLAEPALHADPKRFPQVVEPGLLVAELAAARASVLQREDLLAEQTHLPGADSSARSDHATQAAMSPTTHRCPAMREAAWASAGPGEWASKTSIAWCRMGSLAFDVPALEPGSGEHDRGVGTADLIAVHGEQRDRGPQVVVCLVEPPGLQGRAGRPRPAWAVGADRHRASDQAPGARAVSERAGSRPSARDDAASRCETARIGHLGGHRVAPSRGGQVVSLGVVVGQPFLAVGACRRRAPPRASRPPRDACAPGTARGMRPYATSRTST